MCVLFRDSNGTEACAIDRSLSPAHNSVTPARHLLSSDMFYLEFSPPSETRLTPVAKLLPRLRRACAAIDLDSNCFDLLRMRRTTCYTACCTTSPHRMEVVEFRR